MPHNKFELQLSSSTILTRNYLEQEQPTHPEHLSSTPVCSGACVIRSRLVFCKSLFVFLFWPLYPVLLRFTDSDYSFGIFKLFWLCVVKGKAKRFAGSEGIGIMYPSGATYLSADCCFSELALLKSIACWSNTERISSSLHRKLTCSHHDRTEQLNYNYTLTELFTLWQNLHAYVKISYKLYLYTLQ